MLWTEQTICRVLFWYKRKGIRARYLVSEAAVVGVL